MRRLLFTLLFLASCGYVTADGPGDNNPDKVKPVPPPGIPVPDDVRKELETGLAEFAKLLKPLEGKQYYDDVKVYFNAVYYALKYNEFIVNANSKNPEKDAKGQFDLARKDLKTGMERARQLAEGKHPWTEAKGLVVRGYKSKIDDSTQPYGLVIPDNFDPKRKQPWRLDFWCHGRGDTLTELSFLQQRETSKGQFTPPDTIVCHLYGRFCCANKFAGEVDLFEALEDIAKNYPIDRDRLVIRGFSMGGASTWQFATHFPSVFCAAAPGAGFSETPDFLKVFQKETLKPTPWEIKLWGQYNATDYALNLFNIPTIAYSGEIDSQKQAADMMVKALAAEKMEIPHVIGPKTGHSYHKDSIPVINKFVDEAAAKGRPRTPKEVKFTTQTLRYNKSYWVQIDGMEEHWKPARVEARADRPYVVKTSNVSGLTLMLVGQLAGLGYAPIGVKIDDTEFKVDVNDPNVPTPVKFRKSPKGWEIAREEVVNGLRKIHGLQGPIDDAFMDRFIFVKPSGTSKNAAFQSWMDGEMAHAIAQWRQVFRGEPLVKMDKDITAEDIASANLVLWGDATSNAVLAKFADKLPIGFKADKPNEVPLLIFPNPLNPKKYVVLNSGMTMREYDQLNNARQVPKLPDWAIVDITTKPSSRYPGKVVDAGFFDEEWKVKR